MQIIILFARMSFLEIRSEYLVLVFTNLIRDHHLEGQKCRRFVFNIFITWFKQRVYVSLSSLSLGNFFFLYDGQGV